jgi:uncharacterized protein
MSRFMLMKHPILIIELVLIFFVLPSLLFVYGFIVTPVITLLSLLIYIIYLSFNSKKLYKKRIFSLGYLKKKWLYFMLQRFYLNTSVLFLFSLIYYQNLLFKMLLDTPLLWIGIVFLYPFLSVLPQEILYRSFFFHRYKALFKKRKQMIWFSAFSFSYGHIIFHSWIALFLTFVGGFYFATSYAKTKSLFFVCIEHSLYGIFLFTIGLGYFFHHEFITTSF